MYDLESYIKSMVSDTICLTKNTLFIHFLCKKKTVISLALCWTSETITQLCTDKMLKKSCILHLSMIMAQSVHNFIDFLLYGTSQELH